MMKVKVRWTGFIGSPGWSNFYFDTGNETFHSEEDSVIVADRVAAFFTTHKLKFPAAVTWTVQSDVEVISPTTGELVNVYNAGARAAIVAGGTAASYSASSGAVITWRTAGVRNGRRVRGRTFLVPTTTGVYQNDGTLNDTVLNELVTGATTLAAIGGTLPLGVWSRPSGPGATDGDWHAVTGVSVPDMAAVLRSRRD